MWFLRSLIFELFLKSIFLWNFTYCPFWIVLKIITYIFYIWSILFHHVPTQVTIRLMESTIYKYFIYKKIFINVAMYANYFRIKSNLPHYGLRGFIVSQQWCSKNCETLVYGHEFHYGGDYETIRLSMYLFSFALWQVRRKTKETWLVHILS